MCNVYRFLFALLFVGTNSLGAHSSIEELNKLTSFSHQVPRQPHSHHTLGRHILAEFQGCINLTNARDVEEVLQKAADAAGATVLRIYVKEFDEVLQKPTTDISASQKKRESGGFTAFAALSESHISIHTWPEYDYAAIDIFTCGKHIDPQKAIEILKEFFQPKLITTITISRGFYSKEKETDTNN